MREIRLFFCLVIGVVTLTATALPAPRINIPEVRRSVLSNGLTVLVAENREVPLVTMEVLVRAGSMDDPTGKEGLADLAATMLRRGAGERDAQAFARAIDDVGGTLSTGAGVETSFAQAEFLASDLELGLSLLGDMLMSPRFDSEEVARGVRQAVAARQQSLDDPSRLANDEMQIELFKGHPYGHPTDGLASALESLTREDVRDFASRYWTAANTVLAIVGDVDAGQVVRQIEEEFGRWPAGSANVRNVPLPVPVQGRRVVLVQKAEATQAQIRLCQTGIERTNPDYFPVMVANTVLGGGFTSWLVDEVRVNRGLSYSGSSRFYPFKVGGYFRISTFTKNATVGETIDVALAQVARLRSGPVDSATLSKAKNYINGLYPLRLETSDDLAGALLQLEYYGQPASWIEEYAQQIEDVTAEDVLRVARTHFAYDDLLLLVVGDASLIEDQVASFGPVTHVVPD
jgi:zinc protease